MSIISCQMCGRSPRIAYNKPHSLHRTKRVVRPNLQKIAGRLACTRCLRTMTKFGVVIKAA